VRFPFFIYGFHSISMMRALQLLYLTPLNLMALCMSDLETVSGASCE
jgi:hypothetical protein